MHARAAQVEREGVEQPRLVGLAGGVFLGGGVATLERDDARQGDEHESTTAATVSAQRSQAPGGKRPRAGLVFIY